ncbi:MAG: hypothetical protein K9L59_00490 [Desulfobacterales bacterium]|nr:hypothetical protein [Desulfobacterales bacterium]
MKIAVKYCGGCNPQYDRMEIAQRFFRALNGKIELVSPDDPESEAVVVFVGCDTACVNLEPFKGLPVWIVRSEEDGERLIHDIRCKFLS